MGCDIHIEVFRRERDEYSRVRGRWEWVPPPAVWSWTRKEVAKTTYLGLQHGWPEGRYYEVFGLLAGVRNGSVPVKFPPRGLPSWLDNPELCEARKENGDRYVVGSKGLHWVGNYYPQLWLDFGEHTFSWLTLGELREIDWQDTNWFKEEMEPLLSKLVSPIHTDEDVVMVFGFDS